MGGSLRSRRPRGSSGETPVTECDAKNGPPDCEDHEISVCQCGRSAQWVVRLNDASYGVYLDKEQALLDAVDAARDAQLAGREAQVWIGDQNGGDRVL
jgi:hypothetical protein